MKRLTLLLLFLSLAIGTVWADTTYSGSFSLNGKMGSGITFRIDAQYWGDNPCLVTGQTTYFRKNGKEAHIKLYGTLDGNQCSLYEFVGNRVCGHFMMPTMPSPDELSDIQMLQGTAIEGQWDNQGTTYDFTGVTLECYADVDYDFLQHPAWDWTRLSGLYGYRMSDPEGDISADLQLIMTPDSVLWRFTSNNEVLGTGGECEKQMPGFGHDKDTHQDCFSFEMDGLQYRAEAKDDVIMISLLTDTSELPETDDFLDLRGVYPRYGDLSFAYAEKQMNPSRPEAVSTSRCTLLTPRTDNQRLNDSIRSWVALHTGGKLSADYFEIAATSAQAFFEGEGMEPENYEEDWQMPTEEGLIGFNCYEQKKYINLTSQYSIYLGGAHGMYVATEETMRRSDGKVMDWADWFTHPAQVRPIIEEYMLEQNEDVDFDTEELPLPSDKPWLTPGLLHFSYQQYEAAPYAYGLPSCEIPVEVLLPYMTAGAKSLVK